MPDYGHDLMFGGFITPASQDAQRAVSPGFLHGPPGQWADHLAELALRDGISVFILGSDDLAMIQRFSQEVAPAVRELVDAERRRPPAPDPRTPDLPAPDLPAPEPPAAQPQAPELPAPVLSAPPPPAPGTATSRPPATLAPPSRSLGVTPTPDTGERLSPVRPWDEAARPAAIGGAAARSQINEMTMRQNDWTLGAYCASYCRLVTGHHTMEDDAVFPHLRSADPGLGPVIGRLADEHEVIHEVLNDLDRALVSLLRDPGDFSGLDRAVDLLTDTMVSHLAYEEAQLVEPLARLGFYAGQV